MSEARQRLPNRRPSTTLDVWHNNERYHVSFSKDADNVIREVFVHGPRAGSDLDALAFDIGVAISLGLQFGARIDDLRHSMARLEDGRSASFVGKILEALSPLDGLDMWAEYAYFTSTGAFNE
jgi:hypothetical protein